jgi:phage I-like protein
VHIVHSALRDFFRFAIMGLVKVETDKPELIAFKSAAPISTDGKTLPKEYRLLPFGASPSTDGPVRLGAITRATFSANQHKRGWEKVAIDFEHNTVPGTPAYKESKEPREVAAYGIPELREDGLWIGDVEWTPAGERDARNFADLSPTVLFQNGEVVAMHSVALTRNGAIYDLTAFSAMLADAAIPGTRNEQEEETLVEKILTALRKGLGLDAKADENAIATALEALNLTAMSASLAAIKTKVEEGTTHGSPVLTALDGKLVALSAQFEGFQRETILDQAAREGKVIPLSAEQFSAMPVETLRTMVAKLDATVPVQAFAARGPEPKTAKGLTPEQREMVRNCGLDEKKAEEFFAK